MKKKVFFVLALVLALSLPLRAQAALLEPPANTYVADYADVLGSDLEQYIIDQNKALNDATGGAIVVVTVDFLSGMDIADYCNQLFNEWGIGDKERNNGLLMLLAIGEDNYYSLQGVGINRALTTSMLSDYQWEYLEEDFAAGDYAAGVRKLFDAYYGWFEGYYAEATPNGHDVIVQEYPDSINVQPSYYWMFSRVISIVAFLIFIIVLIAIIDGNRYRRYRRRYYGVMTPPYIYRPFIFGWGRYGHYHHRPPRGPRGPRPPHGGGFGGGGFGGGRSGGGGFGRGGGGFGGGGFGGGGFGGGGFGGGGFGGGRAGGGGAGRR